MHHLNQDELKERLEMENQAAEFSLDLICHEEKEEL